MIGAVSGVRVAIRLQAHARSDEVVGVRDEVLVARVTAPALEGRANRALCRLLAKTLELAPSQVTIVRGLRSRDKLVELDGVDESKLAALLDRLRE
jgi:uncharacterized protein (TIGR00251 family)